MLPADYIACLDHGECPRGAQCQRAALPRETTGVWFAAFFALHGTRCPHYMPMPERVAETGKFARR